MREESEVEELFRIETAHNQVVSDAYEHLSRLRVWDMEEW